MYKDNKSIIDYVCHILLSKKWNISANYIFNGLVNNKPSTLIAIARPIQSGIITDDVTVTCDSKNNKASFFGRVGESNRSVQCAMPFPSFSCSLVKDSIMKKFVRCLNYYSCSSGYDSVLNEYDVSMSRLVTPFLYLENGIHKYCFDIRRVSYYEIHILPFNGVNTVTTPTENQLDEDIQFECVAVGLATKFFLKEKRFPGWDNESFGYHGDDGAIFHGRGRQLGTFGPTFGFNDTIGCGLDYSNQSIFYTLNGMLLGTAFLNVRPNIELYPTVGIDAHCTVLFNFGADEPFAFDLRNYMMRA